MRDTKWVKNAAEKGKEKAREDNSFLIETEKMLKKYWEETLQPIADELTNQEIKNKAVYKESCGRHGLYWPFPKEVSKLIDKRLIKGNSTYPDGDYKPDVWVTGLDWTLEGPEKTYKSGQVIVSRTEKGDIMFIFAGLNHSSSILVTTDIKQLEKWLENFVSICHYRKSKK